jgi:hypothetical protein
MRLPTKTRPSRRYFLSVDELESKLSTSDLTPGIAGPHRAAYDVARQQRNVQTPSVHVLTTGQLGATVSQVNGTPSGRPGDRIRIDAGLSEAPRNPTGYFTALRGPVKMYVASGSSWRYFGTATATGSYGGVINTYAIASFNARISPSAPSGRYIRLKFVYPGDSWHVSATGYGNVYVG